MGLSYGLIVTAHGDKYLRLYRPSDFGFERALLAGSLGVKGFSQTNNGSLLVVGGYDKWMRIFAFDGVDYTELQAIYAGISVIFAKITEEKLIVLGATRSRSTKAMAPTTCDAKPSQPTEPVSFKC